MSSQSVSLFRRQLAIPQDHGSWVFILSPLLVGFFAAGAFSAAAVYLIVAALGVFLLRQPVTMLVKAYAGRRPRSDVPTAGLWILFYGAIVLAALAGLDAHGFDYVLYLAAPGLPVFAWHLWLVSRRAERRQAGVEIVATGVLSLAAPAAFWVGRQAYDPGGWWLWLLTWLQSAASIVHAYMRLEQRDPAAGPARGELGALTRRALAYTSFNVALTIGLGFAGWLPRWLFLPFLVQWLETVCGTIRPAAGWKPVRIGVRQLMVSSLWTALFIICWRLK